VRRKRNDDYGYGSPRYWDMERWVLTVALLVLLPVVVFLWGAVYGLWPDFGLLTWRP
jgi:hypothetical protein